MVKRVACLAIACCVACSLSIYSFAENYTIQTESSEVNLPFPFFGDYLLYQGSALYDGRDDEWSVRTRGSWSGTSSNSGNVYVNLYSNVGYGTWGSSDTFTVKIPSFERYDITSRTGTGTVQDYEYVGSSSTNTTKFNSDFSFTYDEYRYSPSTITQDYTIKDEAKLYNDRITAGDYVISGRVSWDQTYSDSQVLGFIERAQVHLYDSSNNLINTVRIPLSDIPYSIQRNQGKTEFQFSVPFTLSNSVQVSNDSPVYLRFYIVSNANNSIPPISGFSFSTSNIVFVAPADNIQGLSAGLNTWFAGLTSTVRNGFLRLIGRADEEASAMEQSYDSDLDTTTQQGVTQESQVHAFEQQYQGNLQSQAEAIDLTVPSNYGGAISFIGNIFVRTFNNMGSYNTVIMVPLILGMVLHLLGKGQAALGRQLNLQGSEARYQRHQFERRQAAINSRNYSSKYGR